MGNQPGPLGELLHHRRGCLRQCCLCFSWSSGFYLARSLANVINPHQRKCSFRKNRWIEICLKIWCQQGRLLFVRTGDLSFPCWVRVIILPIEFYWVFLTLREFISVLLLGCWNRAMSIKPAARSVSHNSVFSTFFWKFAYQRLPITCPGSYYWYCIDWVSLKCMIVQPSCLIRDSLSLRIDQLNCQEPWAYFKDSRNLNQSQLPFACKSEHFSMPGFRNESLYTAQDFHSATLNKECYMDICKPSSFSLRKRGENLSFFLHWSY